MIRIVHIFRDDKFFDGVSDFFDTLDGVENVYVYFSKNGSKFKYIKKVDKIRFFEEYSSYAGFIQNSRADIIYLHSLFNLDIFKFIPKKSKVIWWSWGYDIYNNPSPLSKPLVDIELYKPLTNKLIEGTQRLSISRWFKYQILRRIVDRRLRKAISRIDYYTPVLPNEYSLMRNNDFFRAQPFRIDFGPSLAEYGELHYLGTLGNILIGNSYTPSNNHLDIFETVKSFKIPNRKFLIPVNYGSGYPIGVKELKSRSPLRGESVLWIENFIPLEEYERLNSSVTHAIFGHMRQQAVGNQRLCITNGVKMFFYKDSVNYQYYKQYGFIVYTIEDDLNEKELNTSLTYEEALHNHNLLCSISRDNKQRYEEEIKRIMEQ